MQKISKEPDKLLELISEYGKVRGDKFMHKR